MVLSSLSSNTMRSPPLRCLALGAWPRISLSSGSPVVNGRISNALTPACPLTGAAVTSFATRSALLLIPLIARQAHGRIERAEQTDVRVERSPVDSDHALHRRRLILNRPHQGFRRRGEQ